MTHVAMHVETVPLGQASSRGNAFFGTLAFATILPLLFLPFWQFSFPAATDRGLMTIWILAGFGHVVSTTWFGLDEAYRPVIRRHRARMLGSLAFLPLAMGGLAFSVPYVMPWLITAYWFWQSHHYNRQNFGILALAAAHEGTGPLPREVGWLLNLTTVTGAIGMGSMTFIYGPWGSPPMLSVMTLLHWKLVAGAFWIAGLGISGYIVATNSAVRSSRILVLFLTLTSLFYMPSLFGQSDVTAFWPYAMAHGLQYLLIMGVLARGSALGLVGLALFGLIAVSLGKVGSAMNGPILAATWTGLVGWHFLADARLWRLRDPEVRQVVKQRFSFIFDKPLVVRP